MTTTAAPTSERKSLTRIDVARVRDDFPILSTVVHGKPLVYLDSAASSQKPRQVIDAVSRYYEASHANIHRGVHYLSERATALYDDTREAVRRFVNARHAHEIVFTRGTTESVNLVASTFGQAMLKPGDEILLSTLEHHSNIVPWQLAAERAGARITTLPITDSGELVMEALPELLGERTRIVAITHVSNALGTVTPIREIVRQAHARGIPVLVDGAQAAPHLPVDVQAIDCDFYVFSGHKMLGPTGSGVLYGKEHWLERLPPYQGGGDMIVTVTMERSTFAPLPSKFEAGTPDIAAVAAFRAAIEYLESLGMDAIAEHEHDLLVHATERLREVDGLQIIGTAAEKAGVLSFTMRGVHPHDIATILDSEGVAVRAGHHCAQPVMRRLNVEATARASFYVYNTREEIDTLVRGLQKVREVFG
jgi:cysteine desulfurase / selenocysteine lyase